MKKFFIIVLGIVLTVQLSAIGVFLHPEKAKAGPVAPPVFGKNLMKQFNGSAGDYFGSSVSSISDQDGDGKEDIVAGAPGSGKVYIYSSKGNLLRTISNSDTGFGQKVAVVSFGGGEENIIVGSSSASPGGLGAAGSVYIYSSSSGELLKQFDGRVTGDAFGASISSIPDQDNPPDGREDILVGAPFADPGGLSTAGSVYILSSDPNKSSWDASLIKQFDNPILNAMSGWSVSSIGDQDSDEKSDIIVGAWGAGGSGSGTGGSVYVLSSDTTKNTWGTALIRQYNGHRMGDDFGYSASRIGDQDGDSKDDVLIGDNSTPTGTDYGGATYIYSSSSGNLLLQIDGKENLSGFGMSSSIGDQDGDGKDDVLVGANGSSPNGINTAGSVFVYSSSSGNLLKRFNGTAAGERLGGMASSIGDQDGDGKDEVIVGANGASPGGLTDAGSAFVYSLSGNILNQTWTKGSSLSNAFNLDDYFSDPTAMKYSVIGQNNIDVIIDPGTHEVSFSSPASWSGSEMITFAAANTSDLSSDSNIVTLTVTPDDIMINPASPNGDNGWYKTAAPTITIADPAYYKWDGGSYAEYTGVLTSPEGEHTLSYYFVGSEEDVQTQQLKVDITAPVVSITRGPDQDRVSASFDDSVIKKYKLDAGGWTVYNSPITVSTGGHTFDAYGIDEAGNIGNATREIFTVYAKPTFGRTDLILREYDDPESGNSFGSSIASMPDQNNSSAGRDDILIGSTRANNGTGAVYIFSSVTGSIVRTINGESEGDNFGASVTSFDDNGTAKILVGAPGVNNSTGAVYIYDADGSNKITINGDAASDTFGTAVSAFNDNGITKILVGAPYANDYAGAVYIYDADGSNKITINGDAASDTFGTVVSAFNDNGITKILVGAQWADNMNGAVYIYATDGTRLTKISNNIEMSFFGASVSSLNDHGTEKIVIGAPMANGNGAIYVYPASGQIEQRVEIFGENVSSFGTSISTITINGLQNVVTTGAGVDGNPGKIFFHSPSGVKSEEITLPEGFAPGTAISAIGDPTGTQEVILNGNISSGKGFGPGIVYTYASTGDIVNQSWERGESLTNAFDLDDYFSDSTSLAYSATGQSHIVVTIDSDTHEVSFASSPSWWTGSETVTFRAENEHDLSTNSNQVTLTVADLSDISGPTIDITHPLYFSTMESSIIVSGSAIDTESDIAANGLTINGIPISNPSSFSATVNLNLGLNTINIIATDKAGNSTTKTLHITRTAVPVTVVDSGSSIPSIIQSASRALAASTPTATDNDSPTFSIADPSSGTDNWSGDINF